MKEKGRKLITTKSLSIVSVLVIVLTIIAIWLFGLGQHRTIFKNSILSTSILSGAFFLFLTIGLYGGVKLKDNIGKITDKLKAKNIPIFAIDSPGLDLFILGDGIEGIIGGIIAWLLLTVLFALLMWLFGTVFWAAVLMFAGMLYWIFFRALRLVFKNSNKCRGNLKLSMIFGFGYTVLYMFWIYGIILIAHYLGNQ